MSHRIRSGLFLSALKYGATLLFKEGIQLHKYFRFRYPGLVVFINEFIHSGDYKLAYNQESYYNQIEVLIATRHIHSNKKKSKEKTNEKKK